MHGRQTRRDDRKRASSEITRAVRSPTRVRHARLRAVESTIAWSAKRGTANELASTAVTDSQICFERFNQTAFT